MSFIKSILNKFKRPDEQLEIKNAIHDQLTFITNSCFLYDKGCKAEAIRIANALSILTENRSGGSKGILRVLKNDIKILSSVPDARVVDKDRLIIIKSDSINLNIIITQNLKAILTEKKFILIYLSDSKEWHLNACDAKGKEISCNIKNLREALNLGNWIPNLGFLLKSYSDHNGNIDEIGIENIIQHLSILLGFDDNYVPGLYFPMIKTVGYENYPILHESNQKYLTIEEWLNEPIYSISDDTRKNHTLIRDELIKTARDQDGGGHFDKNFSLLSYYKSKYGEKLAESKDGEEITTKNFHLIMLRQLGYEILNSFILKQIE